MNLPTLLRRAPRPSATPGPRAEAAPTVTTDETPARGCGWFDSSHELQQGLRVHEHLDADTLARELPLGAWIELQLCGWRAAPPVAAQ